ncbi:uncharacterized protein LOC128206763 isoform X2 [Mya arenaria]|nr:uncharacterized protein LOC128206763 isoform X2 [Mya arenaria]
MGNCLKSCQVSANDHQAQLETNTNVLGTDVDAINDAGGRDKQGISEDAEVYKQDIGALAAREKAEITQPQQQQQQQDEAIIADSTNKQLAQFEKTTEMCVTVIEDAAVRGIERIDDGTDAHMRDLDKHATKKMAEISQSQQQVDDGFRKDLKKILLQHHLNSNSTLFPGPFFHGSVSLEYFYVPPRLSEVLNKMNREKNGPEEEETRPITSLEQLLTPDDTTNQLTIITANAGVGKSSFCKFVSVLWCALHGQKTDTISKFAKSFDIQFDSLKNIPYLLYIPLRDIPTGRTHSIEDIIFAHLEIVIGYQDDDRKNLERIFMDERCLVILDGMDESSLSTLKSPKAKRKYSILITCRPWKLAETELPKYKHVCIDDLNNIARNKLFKHLNTILNTFYRTTFNVEDFFATLETQNLQSLSCNTHVGLQLYCLWQDRNMDVEKSKMNVTLGPTRSHIYADVLEMMFNPKIHERKETQERTQTPALKQKALPTCFDGRKRCKAKSYLIYEIGKIAFKMLVNSSIHFDEATMDLLQEEQFLLDSGLILADRSQKCSTKNKVYRFLHKTYQEMLAAIYMSSLNTESEDWLAFENTFDTVSSPDILAFLCVMNYEQGLRCSELFGDMQREFCREGTLYANEIIEYQDAVQLAYTECVNNGVSNPQLTLRHACVSAFRPQLLHSVSELKSCYIKCSEEISVTTSLLGIEQLNLLAISNEKDYGTDRQTIPTQFLKTLTVLCIYDLNIDNDNLNLASCDLKILILQNLRLKRVTIAPALLENFWVSIKNEIRDNTPPMEVSFAHGAQFSNKLRKLSLDNVTLNETLNIQQCDKLQQLRLDTLTFPDEFHLDLSSNTSLTQIILQNLRLKHATIAPALLEKFWVAIKNKIWDNTPPMEVSFAHDPQFSNKLRKLSLDNVTLNETLNIQQCDKLQLLQLDTLTFPDEFHLDLSSYTSLTQIILQNLRLKHATIAPALLEVFLVYMKKDMVEMISPLEVTFAHGKQFTSKLRKLSLLNVSFNETLFLQQCDKLQLLRLDEILTFNGDFHLDRSSITVFTEVTLQTSHIKNVIITPAQLEL